MSILAPTAAKSRDEVIQHVKMLRLRGNVCFGEAAPRRTENQPMSGMGRPPQSHKSQQRAPLSHSSLVANKQVRA